MIQTFHNTLDPGYQVATSTLYSMKEDGTFTMVVVKLFIRDGIPEQVEYGPYTRVPCDTASKSFLAFDGYGD